MFKFANYGICKITGEEIMKLGSENIKKILVEDTQQFKLSEDLGATNLTHSPSKSKDGSEVFTDPTNSTTPNAGE